jgi:hypothetical protein
MLRLEVPPFGIPIPPYRSSPAHPHTAGREKPPRRDDAPASRFAGLPGGVALRRGMPPNSARPSRRTLSRA